MTKANGHCKLSGGSLRTSPQDNERMKSAKEAVRTTNQMEQSRAQAKGQNPGH